MSEQSNSTDNHHTVQQTDLEIQSTLSRSGESFPVVPGYEIHKELGRGGMGVVYLARQIRAERFVALKMILGHSTEADRSRFQTEVRVVSSIDHPGIVRIYDVGECDGRPFFAMEFAAGGALNVIPGGHLREPRAVVEVLLRLSKAMSAAHKSGVIHRDLKPHNILLDTNGEPKIADFGLARQLDESFGHTRTGTVMGTPSYMSPEQAAGKTRELGPATDIYSLGVILYELLTGRVPFRAATIGQLYQDIQELPVRRPSELNPSLPRDLESICLRCLEKEPRNRYPSAEALTEDLERFLEGNPLSGQVASISSVVRRMLGWRRETTTMVSLSALWWFVGLVAIFNTTVWLLGINEAPVWTVWCLYGGFTGFTLSVNWWYHIRNDSLLTTAERQSLALQFVHLLAMVSLLFVTSPTSPTASARMLFFGWYPTMMIVTGMTIFAHGFTNLGSFFLIGLAFFPLAILMTFWPNAAPLIYGITLSGALVWTAIEMSRMQKRARLQEEEREFTVR